MKRRVIALTLALALLLPSAVFAVADAPEALDIDIEEEELALDEAGEELAVGGDEVTFEDEALILDGDLDAVGLVVVLQIDVPFLLDRRVRVAVREGHRIRLFPR